MGQLERAAAAGRLRRSKLDGSKVGWGRERDETGSKQEVGGEGGGRGRS